jgi:hypothetical protein
MHFAKQKKGKFIYFFIISCQMKNMKNIFNVFFPFHIEKQIIIITPLKCKAKMKMCLAHERQELQSAQ